MPGRSLNHAERSPGTVQSNRIAVLDNGKLDRDWFDDWRSQSPAIAPVLWPRSGALKSPRCYPTDNPSPHGSGSLFSPRRKPIVSRHSDGIACPKPGPRPHGDRALTSAERMRRLREKRKAEAAGKPPDRPPVVIRYRRPKDRRSRPDQWADAINTLTDCLDRYAEWRDNLPASLADSALAERLDAVLELRDLVDQLSLADLPRGFGRN
jgi:hypothetical protein